MRLKQLLIEHAAPEIRSDAEAAKAFDEFLKNIPGRILDVDIDQTKAGKHGVVQGEKVYKFGVSLDPQLAFVEYFDDKNQGEPTMGMYVDKEKRFLTVKGWKVDKKFYLSFKVALNGKVEKVCKMD